MEIMLIAIGFLGLLAWGERLVRWLWPAFSDRPFERALTGFGLLFGGGAFVIHMLGFAGLLYEALAIGILILCATGIALWLADRLRQPEAFRASWPAATSDRVLLVALIAFAILNLLACLTPEIRDAWPIVCGFCWLSFCCTSIDSPRTLR